MNAADITGWIFAHLVFDSGLMETIRSETSSSFREDGSLDTYHLTSSCPVLDSLWFEVLRFYASMTSMRNVTKDTAIDGNNFERGSILMFSARQIALDEKVFGEDIATFDPMRFYRNPKLQFSHSFRPFGGGKMACPVRHLTKHVTFSFVAILLRRYDLSLAFPQPFPRTYEGEPSIGVIRCRDDFYVKVARSVW
jgi:cytochrome P450